MSPISLRRPFRWLVALASGCCAELTWAEQEAALGCQYAEIQPGEVDFDNPREQLRQELGLAIPENAQIGEVYVFNREIFDATDPEEDHWIYRTANALHIRTREEAARYQLLFKSGDSYDPHILQQSERALRDKSYLYNAWVRPFRVCGRVVDVAVVTRDLWTLLPALGFSRSGGENTTILGLTDENFLGYGKRLAFSHKKDESRTGFTVDYQDPNLLGSRWTSQLTLSENSDGYRRAAQFVRPFYKVGANWSGGVAYNREQLTQKLYYRGDSVSEFKQRLESYGLFSGHSIGGGAFNDHRLLYGYEYAHYDFSEEAGETPPDPFPEDRILSYPWIGYQYSEDLYFQTYNFNQIQQIEDIPTGLQLFARLGWSSESFGASEDQWVLKSGISRALLAERLQFADIQFDQSAYWSPSGDRMENMLLGLQTRYLRTESKRKNSWYAALNLAYSKGLTSDLQLTLGGDNGLRGYPLRYQTGDRSFLLTLERRYYSNWHPFELFRLGGAVFVDMGRAWFPGEDNGPNNGVLHDVGIGLRLTSSRIQVTRVLHLDIAVPLDRDEGGGEEIDGVQFLVRGRQTF
ncbi:hypothetical protein ENC22_28580 [Hahella sp. KA22]|uniref:BamA/TamA family outer membrane protein n=1 Tax=Hahella sp. KA22 TaxID=1628392 RepID=UPI000FDF0AD8|nr:BamA/TamA family outer membrane protein [Hahella sp. KA22]AZZ94937.1 hypothetical protein ENC22_28580 [Hahella sp. KA22]